MKTRKHYANVIVGKTIRSVRELVKSEMDDLCWYETSAPTCIIHFTDGTYAVVMADAEGNGTGFLEVEGE